MFFIEILLFYFEIEIFGVFLMDVIFYVDVEL